LKKIILLVIIILFLFSGCTNFGVGDSQITKRFVLDSIYTIKESDLNELNLAQEQLADANLNLISTQTNKTSHQLLTLKMIKLVAQNGLSDDEFLEKLINEIPGDTDYVSNGGVLLTSGAVILSRAISIVRLTTAAQDLNTYEGNDIETEFVRRNSVELNDLKKYVDKNIQLNQEHFSPKGFGALEGSATFFTDSQFLFSEDFKEKSLEKMRVYLNEYIKFKQQKLKESIQNNDTLGWLINGKILSSLDKAYGVN
jgi:hypothetical protein